MIYYEYDKKRIMIVTSNQVDINSWENLINKSAITNFFQSKECYDFYSSLSFMESFVFGVSENESLKGVVVGYIQKDGGRLKQFFTKRAIVIGGALLANDISNEALSKLLEYCKKELARKAIYIEFRNFNDYSAYKNVFQKNSFEYLPHLNFHVDCSSEEIVKRNLSKNRKRGIRISLREGACYVDSPTIEEVYDYYKILSALYLTKIKTPLFPFEFFEKLYYLPFSKILLVKYNNKIIGGTVCVKLGNQTVYEWFACGLDNIYKNIYPSTLATYCGIKYACENNISRFDMMGAGTPDKGYGVRDFKAKFGGTLMEQGRFLSVVNPILYGIGKVGVQILKAKR